MIGVNQIGIPKGQSGWISKLNPLNWFKKDPILKSRKFVEDWYSNKTTQQVYNQNFNDYTNNWEWDFLQRSKTSIEDELKDPNLPEQEYQDKQKYLQYLNNTINEGKHSFIQNKEPESLERSNSYLKDAIDRMNTHAYGYYDSQNFTIPKGKDVQYGITTHNNDYARNENINGINGHGLTSYRNEDAAKQYAGHEEMHSMYLNASEETIRNILEKYGYNEIYLDEGHEALSRLMNVRLLNKLNPNDREWTPERVIELQKNNKGDDRFLNRYSPEAIAEIFNLVADNSQNNMNSDNGIYFAKRGNKLRYLYGL